MQLIFIMIYNCNIKLRIRSVCRTIFALLIIFEKVFIESLVQLNSWFFHFHLLTFVSLKVL